MSRNKKVPMEPAEGFEITEVMTNKGRKIRVGNGIVMLNDGEEIVSVSEKRKEDPSIYNPETLLGHKQKATVTRIHESEGDNSWHMELDRAVGKGKITPADGRALMCISPDAVEYLRFGRSRRAVIDKNMRTAAEWRKDQLEKQDTIEKFFDAERYDYIRREPDALMTQEEWTLIFNTIKFEEQESTVLEVGPGYKAVIQELAETFVKKNADYGNSFEKTLDKRGLTPAIVRMEEKMERMEKLWDDELGNQVDNESIIDSAMDLANYAIMTAMWLKKMEERPKTMEIWADNIKYGEVEAPERESLGTDGTRI